MACWFDSQYNPAFDSDHPSALPTWGFRQEFRKCSLLSSDSDSDNSIENLPPRSDVPKLEAAFYYSGHYTSNMASPTSMSRIESQSSSPRVVQRCSDLDPLRHAIDWLITSLGLLIVAGPRHAGCSEISFPWKELSSLQQPYDCLIRPVTTRQLTGDRSSDLLKSWAV